MFRYQLLRFGLRFCNDIVRLCLPQEEPFDVIFMDPPYGKELEKQVLTYLKDSSLVTPDTLLVVETDLKTDLSYAENLGFQITKTKKYKTNAHYFLCRK